MKYLCLGCADRTTALRGKAAVSTLEGGGPP